MKIRLFYVSPPHTSHLLQPLNVGMFGPLKKAYYGQVNTFMTNHVGQAVSRYNICRIISKAYLLSMAPSHAVNALRNLRHFLKILYSYQIMTLPVALTNDGHQVHG